MQRLWSAADPRPPRGRRDDAAEARFCRWLAHEPLPRELTPAALDELMKGNKASSPASPIIQAPKPSPMSQLISTVRRAGIFSPFLLSWLA